MSTARACHNRHFPSGRAAPAGRCLGLGELPRCSSCDPRVDPVLPADLHYLPVALRGELEYPHDVYPDAGESCLGC